MTQFPVRAAEIVGRPPPTPPRTRCRRRAHGKACGYAYVLFALALSVTYLLVPAPRCRASPPWRGHRRGDPLRVRRHRPRRRLPWWLLAAGTVSFAFATVTAVVLAEVMHDDSFPSVADAVSLGVTFPALLLSLLGLSRSGIVARDRAGVLDALILTAGGGFLAWIYLIDPHLTNPELSALQKAVSVAYPLCDCCCWPSWSGWRWAPAAAGACCCCSSPARAAVRRRHVQPQPAQRRLEHGRPSTPAG